MRLLPTQLSRELFKWTAEDPSRQSMVSLRTIRCAELAELDTSMTAASRLRRARLPPHAGIEFVFGREWRLGTRTIRITVIGEDNPATPSAASATVDMAWG